MHVSVIALGYQENWLHILTSAFMRNALLGGTLVALAAGLIGYFIVVRSSAFAAHALAHIGFPGATGAVLFGLPVTLGRAVFCIGGALTTRLHFRCQERHLLPLFTAPRCFEGAAYLAKHPEGVKQMTAV